MNAQLCTCPWCGEKKTPQGIGSHETWCDENPNPGIPHDRQQDIGLLDEAEAEPDDGAPDPNQSANTSSGGLPPARTLSSSKSVPQRDGAASTDGGSPESCPECGSGEVMDADDAKAAYIDAVEKPNGRAVLAYDLADHACQNPECAALWGEKYNEPVTMGAILDA